MLNKKIKTFLVTSTLVSTITTSVFADFVTYVENEENQVIMDGLSYTEVEKATNKGFLDIYILNYDINSETIELEILRNPDEWGKRATLSEMMTNSNVLAGVNASFFDTSSSYGDILGMEYEDGQLVYAKDNYNRTEAKSSSLNQKKDGTIQFGYISNRIKFATDTGITFYVDSVNGMQDFNNPTVFTGNVLSDTSSIDAKYDLYKVIIKDGRVTNVVPPKTPVAVQPDEIVFMTKDEESANKLPVGTGIVFSVETNLGDKIGEYELVLSGGGTIIKDGQYYVDGMQVTPDQRAPRTAVGTTDDGRLITMVVDGRGESIGVTIPELATLMLNEGVTNAIVLDGGGSSQMNTINHNNVVVIQNQPSDGKERKIANGLGFESTVEDSQLTRIEVEPKQTSLFAGNSTSLLLIGYDQYNRPVYLNDSDAVYTLEGVEGTIEGNILTPTTAGIGQVRANYYGLEATAPIDVSSVAKDIVIVPSQNKINTNGSVRLEGYVTTPENKTIPFDLNNATVTLTNPSMGYIQDGYFYSTGAEGIAYIQVDYAGITKFVSIEVANPFNENEIDYSLSNTYSTNDDNYISYDEANQKALNGLTMFGRIEIEGNANADRAVEEINILREDTSLNVFSGGILTPKGLTLTASNLYRNTLEEVDYNDLKTKVINMQTYKSDASNINQLVNVKNMLDNNVQPNVIIVNSSPSFNYLKSNKFNDLFRQLLNDYVEQTGVNVYLVNGNADRENISVDNVGGVTYIQIPKVVLEKDSTAPINNELYFYLDDDGILKYSFK